MSKIDLVGNRWDSGSFNVGLVRDEGQRKSGDGGEFFEKRFPESGAMISSAKLA